MATSPMATNTSFASTADSAPGCGGCAGEEERSVLNYVGSGAGDYIQETTYKYVGDGAGDYQSTKTGGNRLCLIAAGILGLLCLLLILFICFMPGEATTTTTTTRIDCNYGVEAMWNIAKKAYCCEHANKGCPTTAAPPPPPVVVPATLPPVIVISTPPPPTTPNVCNEGGVSTWDLQKRTFCCQKYGNGCPTTAPPPTLPPTTLPFDCNAGYTNWVNGWSVAKKAWCCAHEKKGCAPPKKGCE